MFNAATKYENASWNQKLLKGSDLLTSLVGVLLRFRQFKVALSADNTEMFHQVRAREQDGPSFRFLWREPGSSEPLSDFQLQVQIFGAVSSPTVCAYVLRKSAEDTGEDEAICYQQITDQFYVDNWLASFPTQSAAIQSAARMKAVLKRGCFELSQWGSSRHEVLHSQEGTSRTRHDLFSVIFPRNTLGLLWDCALDALVIR